MRPSIQMLLIGSLVMPLITLIVLNAIKLVHRAPHVDEDRVRMMMWFRRNPNMTFEEFSDYFRLAHANLFLNTEVVKRNAMLYEQLHVNQDSKNFLTELGFPIPSYDGVMILEAATMDKALECFSNPEYNDIVLPDSLLFSDMSSAVYGPFVVASTINNEPSPTVFNTIRNDTKRAVIAFTHKDGMSYTSFTNYFRNVNPLKIEGLIKSTGIGKEILKYEQLTISSAPVTVSNPFTPMSGWDAVAQVAGPNFPYLLQASQFPDEFTSSLTHLTRCPRIQTADSLSFVRLMNEDVPNFVNVDAGYQVLPVDVVSFQIPK